MVYASQVITQNQRPHCIPTSYKGYSVLVDEWVDQDRDRVTFRVKYLGMAHVFSYDRVHYMSSDFEYVLKYNITSALESIYRTKSQEYFKHITVQDFVLKYFDSYYEVKYSYGSLMDRIRRAEREERKPSNLSDQFLELFRYYLLNPDYHNLDESVVYIFPSELLPQLRSFLHTIPPHLQRQIITHEHQLRGRLCDYAFFYDVNAFMEYRQFISYLNRSSNSHFSIFYL